MSAFSVAEQPAIASVDIRDSAHGAMRSVVREFRGVDAGTDLMASRAGLYCAESN